MELLTFSFEGKERKSRLVTLNDFAAARERIRRDRIDALGTRPTAPNLAAVIAAPISPKEQSDWIMSLEGEAQMVYRCVHDVDETFTVEEAGRMAMEDHPFCTRLYIESKLLAINPPSPDESESPSSKPE